MLGHARQPLRTTAPRIHFAHREGGYHNDGRGTYSGATEIEIIG